MCGDQRLLNAVLVQQGFAVARVLTGDRIHFGQYRQRADADVRLIANRGGDQIQCVGRELLLRGGLPQRT